MPPERGQRRLVEVLTDMSYDMIVQNLRPVTDRDPRRLLAPVLQGIQSEVGELGNLFTRRPDPEHPTSILRTQILRVEFMSKPTIATSHTHSLRDAARRADQDYQQVCPGPQAGSDPPAAEAGNAAAATRSSAVPTTLSTF